MQHNDSDMESPESSKPGERLFERIFPAACVEAGVEERRILGRGVSKQGSVGQWLVAAVSDQGHY